MLVAVGCHVKPGRESGNGMTLEVNPAVGDMGGQSCTCSDSIVRAIGEQDGPALGGEVGVSSHAATAQVTGLVERDRKAAGECGLAPDGTGDRGMKTPAGV